MSLTHTRYGGRVVLEAKGRIRDDEALRNRDREMFAKRCEGKSVDEIARMFRVTPSIVYRRFKAMPFSVRQRIKKDASIVRRARLEYLRDEVEAQTCG